MSEEMIGLFTHKLEEIQKYIAKDMVYRENHEHAIRVNAENNTKLNDQINEISIKVNNQPTERLRELTRVTDEIHRSMRERNKHFDNSLRKQEITFNEFKLGLSLEHDKIKTEVITSIESKFMSNVKTAKWVAGSLFVVIVALISSLSAVSLYVLGNIHTDIKALESVVLYGPAAKTEVVKKESDNKEN